MQAVPSPSLLACPEEAGSAHREHMAVGKNGSKPHSEDVLTPDTAMQWRRKSVLAEQLPGTQIAVESSLLGRGIKANGNMSDSCLSAVPHKNIISSDF